ncbi:MAG TPA: AAA family ATPase [Opitutaceae bacterium]|nr:AAA family ATPase [Opitutaceae bacterium]
MSPALNPSPGAPAVPVLLVIAGPAGSGKSTLCDRLVAEAPGFSRVVTTTTRAPRLGEIDGVHYHFFRPEEFERRIAAGEFLEWAYVHGQTNDRSRLYGTLKSSVLEPLARGASLVMSIDVQGVESLRRCAQAEPRLRRAMSTVFIVVERERLIARMRERAKDHEDEIARRMATAEAELREAPKFDYIIESKSRDEDFARLLAIVGFARERALLGG